MYKNRLKMFLITVLLGSSFGVSAKEVFTWKDRGHNTYSDTPSNLTPTQAQTFNVYTHTSSLPAAASASAAESTDDEERKKIQDQNKKNEEYNKKVEAQNKKDRQEACKTARLNRQMADSIRSQNRDQLIKRYDELVSNYCN